LISRARQETDRRTLVKKPRKAASIISCCKRPRYQDRAAGQKNVSYSNLITTHTPKRRRRRRRRRRSGKKKT
jgi:hypothetical protein